MGRLKEKPVDFNKVGLQIELLIKGQQQIRDLKEQRLKLGDEMRILRKKAYNLSIDINELEENKQKLIDKIELIMRNDIDKQ